MIKLQNPMDKIAPDVLSRICSPALLFFPERIAANIESMIRMVGNDPSRLRPHVKTHKCGTIVRQLVAAGITRHKCATLREAEVLAENGATDILLAYPAVGPLAIGLARLAAKWPKASFSTVIDSPTGWADLSNAVRDARVQLGIFIEIDVGHGRTGLSELDFAVEFARTISSIPGFRFRGLHGYDGHVGSGSASDRPVLAAKVREHLTSWKQAIERAGFPVETLILAGSPSFPHHAANLLPGMELSPGTVVLHDWGYGKHAELGCFVQAVAVLTRVIGRPTENRLTFDCGSKAIACDQPSGARLVLEGLENARGVLHNEEHLVVEAESTEGWVVGKATLAWPVHACPTSAWYDEAIAIDSNGNIAGIWPIDARGRGPRIIEALA